jgi:hypothetical protein
MHRAMQPQGRIDGRDRTLLDVLGIEHDDACVRRMVITGQHRQQITITLWGHGRARDKTRLAWRGVITHVIASDATRGQIQACDRIPAEADCPQCVERPISIQYRCESPPIRVQSIPRIDDWRFQASPPELRISLMSSSSCGAAQASAVTRAPFPASRREIALPMPRPAPVTRADWRANNCTYELLF